jgi:glucose-1-phosphate cytidylyltransferase
VTLIDTGQESMTGGRLRRVMPYLKDDEAFCMTYGDGVGNIDITALTSFHKSHGKQATVTAVPPAARFGRLDITDSQVTDFSEKPAGDGGVINGGFFVLSPKVARHLKDDSTIWERAPLTALASEGELMAFEHRGFWQPMDTIREKQELEAHWASGKAPWKIW